MRSLQFSCSLLASLVMVLTPATVDAANLDVEKISGSCNIAVSVLANESALAGGVSKIDWGDSDDISATATNSLTLDDGVATAEVIIDGLANCNLATNAAGTLGSINTATQQFAEAYTPDAFNNWVRAGTALWGHSYMYAITTALFEIQPDPIDPLVSGGVVNGIMDVIATESVNGIATTALYDGYMRCGRYYIEYTGLDGVTNVDIGYIDDIWGPSILVSYIGGAGVNYIVTTAEVRPIYHQIPAIVEQWTLAAAEVVSTNSFAATSIVSQSGSSSVTVRGIHEDDDPEDEYLAVIVDEEVIDDFPYPH